MRHFFVITFIVAVSLAMFVSCSILRVNKDHIASHYSKSNFFIESAYTSFYNDNLRVSTDLYAEFAPSSECNMIERNLFNTNARLINKYFGVKILTDHFVYQMHSKQRDLVTSFYFIPGYKNLQDSVIYLQYKNRYHALYNFNVEKGSYFQLFSIHDSLLDKRYSREIFRDECSSIMSKFCYKNYYKAAKWHNDGMSIYLYGSDFLENPGSTKMFEDTLNITFPKQKIIGIANNRGDYSVFFKLLGPIANLVKNQAVYLNVYNRQSLILKGMEASPIYTERVISPSFFKKLNVNYDDYIFTLSNDREGIYVLFGLYIW